MPSGFGSLFPNLSSRLPQRGSPLREWRAFAPIKLPVVIAIMAAAFLLTGCGKKPAPSSTATTTTHPVVQPMPKPTPAQNNNTAASAQNMAAPAQNSQTNEPGAGYGGVPPIQVVAPGMNAAVPVNLTQLTGAMRLWRMMNGHTPTNFEEFAAKPNIQIPPPPPGKKYAIDRKLHVILVNR